MQVVAAYAAMWILLEDYMSQQGYQNGSPFEPLIDIYSLGYEPLGYVKKGRRESFAVFVPPIQTPATH